MVYDVAIIGAGVIGGMLARQLMRKKISVCLLEKENDVACGASKANSGIVHGGYDPEPNTLKAKLNTAGVKKLFDAAQELNVPYRKNGSMICAFSEEEDKKIKDLYNRGKLNKVKNMKILGGNGARTLEPRLSKDVTSALLVENAGIICPYELTIAAVGNAMDNGAHLKLNFEVVAIEKKDCFVVSSASGESVECRYLVNCAGVYSDKIAHLAGDDSFTITPRAGEYILLDKNERCGISHTIFQVPSKEGKGILVSPTVDGNLLTGPTAVYVERDDTDTTEDGLDNVIRLASKSVPDIDFRNRITSFSGIRASEKNGDFIIGESEKVKKFVNVAAIDSPGLSCSAIIAEYVDELLASIGLNAEANENFVATRENMHAFRNMTDEQKDEYIKDHPDYGKIVCRCETVSEGEIVAVIRKNPQAKDVDGVKRRIRAGMGRCQGGFCGTQVMALLAKEQGTDKRDITKKGNGSHMIVGRVGDTNEDHTS